MNTSVSRDDARFSSVGASGRDGLLAYEAPFLIEKLLKNRTISTAAEGDALFREFKRYVIMHCADSSKLWQMHSIRVDAVWHEFVLFTQEYWKFCMRFLGEYLPHSPSNAPGLGDSDVPVATLAEFQAHYEVTFGESLPAIWNDENHVTLVRRLIVNDGHGPMAVRPTRDGRVELACTATNHEHVYVRVDAWARPALQFVIDAGAFYVREIPGPMLDEDRIALGRALVRGRAALVAS